MSFLIRSAVAKSPLSSGSPTAEMNDACTEVVRWRKTSMITYWRKDALRARGVRKLKTMTERISCNLSRKSLVEEEINFEHGVVVEDR